MNEGFLHVYTGDGKGKSTAAFGLAVRARGAGLSATLIQFIKNKPYSETGALEQLGVVVRQFGEGPLFGREPVEADREAARRGLEEVRRLFEAGLSGEKAVDVLILDEINVALSLGLVNAEAFHALLDLRPRSMELICTGRNAPESLIDRADLVTEMRAVKHYFDAGIPARDGIEK